MLHVTSVRPHADYILWLRFSDGVEGFVDLSDELQGPIFEPLRNPEVFAKVRVDDEIGTIAWPNGADVAPEFLRGLLQHTAAKG